jgi:hypothetical protein
VADKDKQHMKKFCASGLTVVAAVAFSYFPLADAQAPALPPQVRQATPEKVIAEHVAAMNACDWKRAIAQYSDDSEFMLPGGSEVKGRAAVGDLLAGFLKSRAQGGWCGLRLFPEKTVRVGDTINMIWRMEAPFLAEPYRGSEAYETRDGLMVLQVTTFDTAAIKLKQ